MQLRISKTQQIEKKYSAKKCTGNYLQKLKASACINVFTFSHFGNKTVNNSNKILRV